VLNAIDAAERGATCLTRTACVDARAGAALAGRSARPGGRADVTARALVNAAGPWAAQFLPSRAGMNRPPATLRLVKGSHIVVPKLFDHDHAYIFQNDDRRIIFANPYEGDLTLIGTTDVELRGRRPRRAIDAARSTTCCAQANRYFRRQLAATTSSTPIPASARCYDDAADPSAVTRDYVFDLDAPDGQAPLLSAFGGKITTFRKLSEEAADLLAAAA
jgi:glycerol-3-phosphate dehydrogenase